MDARRPGAINSAGVGSPPLNCSKRKSLAENPFPLRQIRRAMSGPIRLENAMAWFRNHYVCNACEAHWLAERAEEISVERAEASKQRAEERLAKAVSDIDYERARLALMKSIAQPAVSARVPGSRRHLRDAVQG